MMARTSFYDFSIASRDLNSRLAGAVPGKLNPVGILEHLRTGYAPGIRLRFCFSLRLLVADVDDGVFLFGLDIFCIWRKKLRRRLTVLKLAHNKRRCRPQGRGQCLSDLRDTAAVE